MAARRLGMGLSPCGRVRWLGLGRWLGLSIRGLGLGRRPLWLLWMRRLGRVRLLPALWLVRCMRVGGSVAVAIGVARGVRP